MAILDNNSREIVGGITQISDQTTDPTTAGNDLISLSGVFLLAGTTSGVIDGLGETSADTLELTSANLSSVDIVNIEATQIESNGNVTIDANEIADLGALTITDFFSSTAFDANLRLNFGGGATNFSSIFGAQSELGDDERLSVTATGQLATHNVTLDFSNIVRNGVDSYLSYTGSLGNETVTGTTGDDSINASTGTNSITGGDGDDRLTVSTGLSTVQGGAGNDTITSSSTSGLFEGGADDDVMNIAIAHAIGGIRQTSTIDGGAGMDTLNVSSTQGVGTIVDAGSEDDILNFVSATLIDATVDGGTGTDEMRVTGTNLTGAAISGIESTLFTSSGTVTVDADEIVNFGAISITNVFSSTANDANVTLNFAGLNATSTSFAALTSLGMGERFNIGTTGQIAGQTATVDFSNIGRGTDDGSYLRYAGGSADETITGSTGDDSISASSGTNSVSGGVGNDVLATSTGYSTVLGGAGEDTISTSSTSGLFDGGADNDTITVSISFNDNGRQPSTILGGTGDDQLTVSSSQGSGTIVDAGTDDDTIILTSANLVDATIDGGSGTDQLRMTGTNLTGGTISGIESTLITSNGTNTLNADQVGNLGVLDITDVFGSTAFDANMTLNYAGLGTSVNTSFGALSGLDAGERIHVTTAGQTAGQSVTIDFSGIGRGTDDGSELRYSGFTADETIIGTDGEDSIAASSGDASISAGMGDDTISTSSGYVTLLGGDGNDTISTSNSSGIIDGGADNDRLNVNGAFVDGIRQPSTISGGSGFDEINVSSTLGSGSIIDGGTEDDILSLTNVSNANGTVDGGSGTDLLRITSTNLTGADILNIESTVFTSNGTNTIDADDIVNLGDIDLTDVFTSTAYDANITLNYTGLGSSVTTDFGGLTQMDAGERLSITTTGQTSALDAVIDFSGIGRVAADTYLRYSGSTANETITGSDGADELNVASGTNFADGGAGDDSLRSSSGYSTLLGGDGDDTIFGSSTSGVFDGGADNDFLSISGSFTDTVRQPATITGGTGDDQIALASTMGSGSIVDGGADDDTISMSSGTLLNGTVDGGAGTDELRLTSANFTGTDISNIESTVFTSNGTTRIASTEITDLGAITATDVFSGTTSRDANLTLVDTLDQTADFSNLTLGVDQRFYVTYAFVTNGVTTVDFSGVTGDATSILEFDGVGGTGRDDLVIASDVTDDFSGGSNGDDTISYQGSDAGVIIDIDTQSVSGGFADGDTISNFEHATGSEFGDDFTGDTDDNIFTGLGGSDTYNSGDGDDVVVITNLNGNDLWNDFTSGGGANRVDLRGLDNYDAILGFLTATEQLGNTVLSFNSGGSIILTGEALANFSTDDVLLNDAVYAIDESFTTTEDQVLTGNILDPNPPLGFADLEIIGNMIAAPGGIEVQDFTVEGFQYLAGTTATFSSGATLTVLSTGAFTYDGTNAIGAQSLNELLVQTLSQDFSYTAVSTVTGETDQGDVDITVTAVNDAPIITGTVDATATEDGAPVVVDLLGASQDIDDQDVMNAVNVGVLPAGASVLNNQLTLDPSDPAYQSLSQGEMTTVSLTYSVQDQSGATVPGGQANVVITGINDDPTLAAGAITTAVEDGPSVTLDLTALGDDIDSEDDGTTLTYSVTGQPSEGSASVLPDGDTLSFSPGADFQDLSLGETRQVTVQVTATDAQGATAVNDVTVTVTGTNDDPTLAMGAITTAVEDGPSVTLDLTALGDDIDSEDNGTTLTYTVTGQPSEGSASILPNGDTLSFSPGSDFQDLSLGETRQVTVQVTATDARGATAVNDVTVTVTGTNDAPTLAAGFLTTVVEDGGVFALDLTPLGADMDSEDNGFSLIYSVTGQPSEGAAAISGNGDWLLFGTGSDFQDLSAGETRQEIVQVTATDQRGATAVNDMTVTITGTNDDPTLAAGAITTAVEDGPSVTLDLTMLGADIDSEDDGTTLTYTVTGQPSEGSAVVLPDGDTLSFNPGADFQDLSLGETRQVIIQVTATDAQGATAVNNVTVTVTGTNDDPTLAMGAITTAVEDGPSVTLDLTTLGDDIDSEDDGTTLTYAVTGQPSEGSASILPDGDTLSFNPGSDFQDLSLGETRQVTVQVTATDAQGATAVNDVVVTITGTNDDPTMAARVIGNAVEDGPFVAVNLATLGADADSEDDGTTLTYAITGQPAEGMAQILGDGLTLRFSPGTDFQDLSLGETRQVAIQVSATDAQGATASNKITVTVTGTNDAPTLAARLINNAFEDGSFVAVNLATLGADADSEDDGASLTYTITGQPNEGTAQILGDGLTLRFFPGSDFQHLAAGEWQREEIQVTATDAQGATAVNYIAVIISGTNDGPTLSAGVITNAVEDGPSVTLDLTALGDDIDSNDDGTTLTYTVTGQPSEGSASVLPDGDTLSFSPGSDFQDLSLGETRQVTVQVTATDAQGATAVNNVTVTVTGTNDDPTLDIGAITTAVEDGQAVTLDLTSLGGDPDSDDDGTTLTYAVTGQPTEGSASILVDGTTLSFNPGSDFQDLSLGETRQVTVQVTATDAQGATAVNDVTVTVTGTNDAPTLAMGAITTAVEDGPSVTLDLTTLGADIDSEDDGSTLTYAVTGQPSEGSASILVDGTTLSFNPGSDFQDLSLGETRQVTVQITATDAQGATAVNDVTVTVTGTNDDPTLAMGAITTAVEDGPAVTLDLTALGGDADSEDDGTTLTYAVTGQPSEGSASILPDGDTLSFNPGSDFQDLSLGETRQVTVQITATDAQGATAVNDVTVTVTGTNDDPTLAMGAITTAVEDGPAVTLNLTTLGGDTDSEDDGTTLTYTITGQPTEGSATILVDGDTLSFDPGADFQELNAGETRQVTIQVTATDAQGGTAVNDVVVTVTGADEGGSTAFADLIQGTFQADTLDGLGGNDTIFGAGDNDTINGGTDNDQLFGNAGQDSILGGGGDDLIFGNDDDDTIEAGAGNDTVSGGSGRDTIFGNGEDDSIRGDGDADRLVGGFGNDTLDGGFGWDVLIGNDNNDLLLGRVGDDRLDGGAGRDTLEGGAGNDNLIGAGGDDVLRGEGGVDRMFGGFGNDLMEGSWGWDVLVGNDGQDTLNGGIGNDRLTGGNDADVFIFASGDGTDAITDYQDGVDQIQILSGASGFGDLTIYNDAGDAIVEFDNVTVRLESVVHTTLDASDFLF